MEQLERFREFGKICQSKNDNFYKKVGEKVTVPVLQQAARIATDAPTSPIRQDEGIVPKFKFFRIYAIKCPISFDHEQGVAQAYAYLGQGLSPLFEAKVQELFGGSTAHIVTV